MRGWQTATHAQAFRCSDCEEYVVKFAQNMRARHAGG